LSWLANSRDRQYITAIIPFTKALRTIETGPNALEVIEKSPKAGGFGLSLATFSAPVLISKAIYKTGHMLLPLSPRG
jgi:hypothetical protein